MVQDFSVLSVPHNSVLDINFKHILALGLLISRPGTCHELYQSIIVIIIIIIIIIIISSSSSSSSSRITITIK